jgi:chemosensory pili system protein ChpA (sensor histidine kinase/response regulator)
MAQAGHQNAHALDWVRGELDETLKQAVQSLEFFVENTGDEYELTACTESLNQVIGTLRLVELDAAVHYTQAMVELLEAVREDRVERSETIFEALMRGLLQLPAYLEYIQSGGADMIQALLPEINELRQLWGQKALGPEQFFDVALDVEPPAPTQPPAAPLAELAAKARPTYQKALVAWLRNPQDPNALRVLLRVCELVRQAAPGAEIARLWWAAGGLFEGLGAGAIPADGEAKQLLTALDRELKKHAEQGEVDAADAALTRRLLYRVGQAVDAGPLSRELDAAFGLAGRVPSAELVEEVGRRLHGPDTTVLRSVGQAVKEDFNRARDIIEIFGASSEPNPADLGPLQDNLGRMADTLGMMGLNDLADAVREQRNAVQQMADGSLAADEPRVVDVAEVLLHVDTFLKELADESQRALRVTDVVAPVPTIGANTDGIAQPRLTDLESRQVARALYGVGLQELEQVRNSVIAEEESSAPLADQPPRLIALAGGMHMLGHEQAAVQLGQLAGVVEEATHEPLEGSRLEMLADAITGLESTLEAYRADQSASRYLEVADERLAELMGFIQAAESAAFDELAEGETAVDFDLDSAAGATAQEAPVDLGLEEDLETPAPDMDIDAPMEAAVEEVEPAPEDAVEAIEVAEAEPEPEPESEPEVLAEPEPELEAEPAVAESAEAPLHPVLSEEYDAETLDIFLEEADEVVGMLQEQVPQWIANPSDGELLGDIRRAFHTLKGSGRLVGAMLIGEFAWGYESLLNRVTEGTREAGPELLGTLERVVALLPGLVDQLRGGPSPGGEVAALMAAAEALGEGRSLPAEAAAVPLVEAPAVEEVATTDAGVVEEAAPEDVMEAVEVAEAEPEPESELELEASAEPEPAPEPEPEPEPESEALAETEPVPVPRIDAQLYAIYRQESEAHLDTLSSFVARAGESAVPTEGVVRALHTLRGSSSMPEAQSIAQLAGALEEQCKPRLATGEALTEQGVEQLGEATELIRQTVAALGDRELPIPESDGLLGRITDVEGVSEAALEASANELLIHGADLIDLLDDGVSRWVAASADNEPLRQLADEAAEVARQAGEVGQPAVAEVCALLETFAGLLANGRFGPEGEILALLGDTGSGLTEMFDSLAVSRPADPDPLLVIGLRSRIDEAQRVDESPEPETEQEPEPQPEPEKAATEPESGAPEVQHAEAAQPTEAPDESAWSPESPLDPDLLEIFMEEGSELLDEAEATVHRWQEDVGDREAIALLQRQLHTLKGGARMAGIEPMGDLSHASESLLTGVVEGRLETSDMLFEVLNESVDRLVGMLEAVRDDRPVALASNLLEDLRDLASGEEPSRSETPAPAAEPPPTPEAAQETAAPATADASWSPESPLDPDLLEIFLEEGSELLDEAEATVHRWQEAVGDREAIALLQRQLHTLKGGARMAGIEPMGDLSHASESLLTGVVEGRLEPSERLFTELNAAVDRLAEMLDAVRHQRSMTHASGLCENLLALAEGRTPLPPVLEPLPEVELPLATPPPKTWSEAKPAERAEEAPAEAAPQAAARRAPVQQQEQVRVPAQLLNTLVNMAGEMTIYRSRLEQQNNVMRFNLTEFEQTVERLREQLRTLEIETDAQIMSRLESEGRTIEDFDPLEMDQYTALQTTSRALLESLNDLTNVREYLDDLSRESDTLLLQQSRVNTELQQGLMQARMMPFSRLVPRMRRIVRQTAQEMGKKVELWVQGEQSEVDSAVVDRIIAPLEHLIRNAIAHGIESPEGRQEAGKDPVGKLTLTVDRDGSDNVFRVKDDGAGIDVDRVRHKAVERGLLAPDAEISEHDILQLIFESGMSTAKEVTQISGRGVGMDVVISEVRQLGGTVEINSKRGFGASFYLRIPFTLAVNRALLVEVGDELFAIPLTSIEGIVRMRADELEAYYGGERERYTHAGSEYQVRRLGALLGTSVPALEAGQERIPVLLVRSGEQGIALHVDGLVGSREIVVKSVGPQLSSVRSLFGATILVDGRVALILDTNALALMGAQQEAAQARQHAVEEVVQGPRETTVMIVDDSITVRRVTARLLERHDFRVITAKDGVDALQVLQDEHPDIMLLDIEMPRMDGFEVAQHVRGDPRLQKLPIIMITSRTGDKHRQRGMEIGVNRFLGKPYQDAELLDNIRELTGAGETVDG